MSLLGVSELCSQRSCPFCLSVFSRYICTSYEEGKEGKEKKKGRKRKGEGRQRREESEGRRGVRRERGKKRSRGEGSLPFLVPESNS